MRVRVLFFGRLKEITGCNEDWAELAEGASVAELFARYGRQFPQLGEYRASLVAAVNEEFARWDGALRNGDEVAFLPPVSGGAETAVAEDMVELVRQPIRASELLAHVKAPKDGAVVVFDGIVRNTFQGRVTLYLDYEAYEPMALRQMREIAAQLRTRFRIDRVALVHRLGRLEIGETSILIAVSAPHRAAAFDACRFAIEAVKRSVPIWKKEHFADGAVWVEGSAPGPLPPADKPFTASPESDS
jgi:molybdopterin synthase catalytic subunit